MFIEGRNMTYLATIAACLLAAWLFLRKRQAARSVTDCRDPGYLNVFRSETLASDRGKVADELSESNPAIAHDRDYFIKLCYNSGVSPELAAHAWVDRALSARFRHKPH
jgi:hypothetical protein